MIEWVINNIGSIIIGSVLLIILTLILVSLIKRKKKGKGRCGCGCANCPMSKSCNTKRKQ